jgi:hypothetical protein
MASIETIGSVEKCRDCDIDVQVDNIVFVHGSAHDGGAIPQFDR